MNRVEFNCYDDLVGVMQTLLKYKADDEYKVIAVHGKFDVIKNLLEELIMYGETIDGLIELENCEYSHYDKEFALYLTEDGVSVEKTWCDEDGQKSPHYLDNGADVAFVYEDCNSKLLEYIESDIIYEFGFVDEDCTDGCANSYDDEYVSCDGCECCDCCDNLKECSGLEEPCDDNNEDKARDVAVKSEEQYFVNGKSVSKDEYEKYRKVFDEKMKEFMDFWNHDMFFHW